MGGASGEGPGSGPLRMLPGAGLPLTAGALPRHRRVWGDPRPLRRGHLHQPDRELPVRVPRRLPLQRRAAGLRRCHLPDLPGPGWEAASPPRALRTCHLSAISLSFPFCRMGLMPVQGPPSHITALLRVPAPPRGSPRSEAWGRVRGWIPAGRPPPALLPVGCVPQTGTSVPSGRAPASRTPTASISPAATAACVPEGTSCHPAGLAWVSGDPSRVQDVG